MVFGGHIHYYMRSKPMNGGVVTDSYKNGTVYVISIGIPSRHKNIGDEPYAEVSYGEGQFYQYLKVEGNKLIFTTFNAEGKVADSFTIKK